MRFWMVAVLCLVLLAVQVSAEEAGLKNQKDKASYSLGMNFGEYLKKQDIEINTDILVRGLKDMLAGKKTLLTEQEYHDTMTALQKEMMTKQMEKLKQLGEKNKKEGEDFLAENKKKEGVITLPSGLQYKVLKEGDGAIPKLTDTVTTNYRGTLIDGKEFDSSYRREQSATFPVKGVIPGWTEALQLMKAGSKWQLFIPSNLAYGERGAGRDIGPNAMLIFEVELLSIKQAQETKEIKPEKEKEKNKDKDKQKH